MKFKKLKWKNLLSYGNIIQTIEFDDNPKLILVEGENGSGKSSIKEALTVSAYGKSALRKMKDLPNWVNKSAYTYNEFETDKGDTVIIERGIDPNFSNIKINGVDHNLPDKRKIDEFIENELFNLSFSIFCNTISLSFDDFKSFVNLSASDKRKIVDPIFGIDILTDMKSKVKEEAKESKNSLNNIDLKISNNSNLLEKSINQLKKLREKLNEEIEDKTEEITQKISKNKEDLSSKKEEYLAVKTKIDKVRSDLSNLRSDISASNTKILEYDKKLNIFKNNRCPHCLSDLTGDKTLEIKQAILNKKESENKVIENLKKDIASLDTSVSKLVSSQESSKEEYLLIKSNIASLENELAKTKNSTETDQEESINEIISTIKEEISQSEKDRVKHSENVELYSALEDVLSDTGIKRVLIDKVIPLLNSRISEISDRLDFKFNFSFDNEFNPIIMYMGSNISPESLSTGQRKKMNLIVLLSFIELIKMKHNGMNVMFLDEIFSGLDKKNVYMAIKILKEYAIKYNMTIFVVSHESLPEEFFDTKINVTMPNHFSEITITSNIEDKKEPTNNIKV